MLAGISMSIRARRTAAALTSAAWEKVRTVQGNCSTAFSLRGARVSARGPERRLRRLMIREGPSSSRRPPRRCLSLRRAVRESRMLPMPDLLSSRSPLFPSPLVTERTSRAGLRVGLLVLLRGFGGFDEVVERRGLALAGGVDGVLGQLHDRFLRLRLVILGLRRGLLDLRHGRHVDHRAGLRRRLGRFGCRPLGFARLALGSRRDDLDVPLADRGVRRVPSGDRGGGLGHGCPA